MEKEDLIIAILKETREDVKETREDISMMKVDVEMNRKDLELHMEQTRAVKQLALDIRKEANTRIEKIEKKLTVGHLLKLIVTVAGGIGTITGMIYAISRLF